MALSRFGVLLLVAASSACSPGRMNAIGLAPGSATTDLLAHYTFDEGSGTVVTDHSGNHRDGALVGGAWVDGRFGGALHLDGSSYVTVNSFPDAPHSFSVSAWVRLGEGTPDADLETVVSTEMVFDAGWEINVDDALDGGFFQAAYWDRGADAYAYANCTCVSPGTWTQFAFVVDGDAHTLSIYADARLVRRVPAIQPIAPGTPWLSIGRWSETGRMLVGDVDDVVVYGRALAAEEIALLHDGPGPIVD